MTKINLTEGTEVYYNGMYGVVRFVCNNYVTVCVRTFQEKVRDVCILVYPDEYDQILLAKESTK
jgi:hypothetical protein